MPIDVIKKVEELAFTIYYLDPDDKEKAYSENSIRLFFKKALGVAGTVPESKLHHSQRGRLDNYIGVFIQEGWATHDKLNQKYILNKSKFRTTPPPEIEQRGSNEETGKKEVIE